MKSRRFTTNSRGPGQWGTAVEIHPTHAEKCPKCGGWRPVGAEHHSPHFAKGGGLVDCVGDRIERKEGT